MRKYLVLILVAVFVSAKGINAETEEVVWTAGSSVNATFGPEDAVYCRLKNRGRTILYDGFGQCRITLDRVTMDHKGYWEIITGNPGSIFVRSNWIRVNVLPNEPSKLVIEPSVVSNQSSAVLTCSVPKGDQVKSCIFRNPSGTLFVATPEVTKDANHTDLLRYETFAGENYCRLTLFKPTAEVAGYWRCAVNTTSNSGYGFLDGTRVNHLNPHNFLPPLESNYHVTSSVEGDTVHMSCSIHDVISYCYFRAPNGTIFNISPSTSTADYEYIGNGFDAGECGMRINNIRKSADGRWHCVVGVHRRSMGTYYEKSDNFYVQAIERLAVTQRFESNGWIIMSLRVNMPYLSNLPSLEYCRFVRRDGLSFVSFSEPNWYYIEMPERSACKLNIIKPEAADVGLWTVAAKVAEQEEELITTFNLEPRPWTSRSGVFSIIFWCFFGTLILCVILGSCLPKKNREWTRRSAVRIRNSFRRQPQQQYPQQQQQPQQQNAADLPQPVIHTDILTDLPRKV